MHSLFGPSPSATRTWTPARWLPAAATAVLVLLFSSGAIVALRRMTLGLAEPLGIGAVLLVAVVMLTATLAIRYCTGGYLEKWLPTMLLVMWALACSFPSGQVAAWGVWLLAIAIDFAVMQLGAIGLTTMFPTLSKRSSTPATSTDATPNGAAALAESMNGEDETVLQQVMRLRDPNGREYVYATLRGEFPAGQRGVTLYVGFCPPFAVVPQVEAEVIEGPAAMAKVVQSQNNGAQIDVDLDQPSLQGEHVTVEVAAFPPEG